MVRHTPRFIKIISTSKYQNKNKRGVFLSYTIQTRLRKFRRNPYLYCERTISKSIDFKKPGYSLLLLVN